MKIEKLDGKLVFHPGDYCQGGGNNSCLEDWFGQRNVLLPERC